jgi:rhamnogalacturonan acetylesterase
MRTLVLAVLLAIGSVATPVTRQAAQQPPPQPAGPPPLTQELPPLPPINPGLPTVFLVGDSTVKVGTAGQRGWGEAIGEYFDLSKVNVVNYARGGRSSRTFQTEGLWTRVLAAMRPGDFVLIQFGHNDGGELFETTRPRASLPGIGDETRGGTVALTQTFEVVRTFGWYLRQYVTDARSRGAKPIVCSLVPRGRWAEGHIVREPYARWAQETARKTGVPFLDLNEIIARKYEALGAERVAALFADAGTHTTPEGAALSASLVVAGLKALGSPLRRFFSPKAASE